jgi:hypothetical protein
MTYVAKRHLRIALALAVAVGCLFGSEDVSLTGILTGTQSVVTQAQAIIGRPLTPMSYAGVARRTVRRGVYYR